MTPIEQVQPATRGNWARRPETKRQKRESGAGPARPAKGKQPAGDHAERREHIVDERV